MLPKTHLTLHSRMSGSRGMITPSWLSGSWRSFLSSSSVCSCHGATEISYLLKITELTSSRDEIWTQVVWLQNLQLILHSFSFNEIYTSYGRKQWHPTPMLLPGESQGRGSLVGCSPWGRWRVGHDWVTSLSLFTFVHWRRKWQPTPVWWAASVGSHRVRHDWSDLAAAAAAALIV